MTVTTPCRHRPLDCLWWSILSLVRLNQLWIEIACGLWIWTLPKAIKVYDGIQYNATQIMQTLSNFVYLPIPAEWPEIYCTYLCVLFHFVGRTHNYHNILVCSFPSLYSLDFVVHLRKRNCIVYKRWQNKSYTLYKFGFTFQCPLQHYGLIPLSRASHVYILALRQSQIPGYKSTVCE